MHVINLYGGPGIGKSTLAASVFAELKQRGYAAELMREPFKRWVWDDYRSCLSDQAWITGNIYHELKQYERGGVEVVVSDCPLLLAVAYGASTEDVSMPPFVASLYRRFQNFDVRLERAVPYDPKGRRQNEQSARDVDQLMDTLIPPWLERPWSHLVPYGNGPTALTHWPELVVKRWRRKVDDSRAAAPISPA